MQLIFSLLSIKIIINFIFYFANLIYIVSNFSLIAYKTNKKVFTIVLNKDDLQIQYRLSVSIFFLNNKILIYIYHSFILLYDL